MLTEEEIEFLKQSNLIEGISSIDYSLPENQVPGEGHVGAFLDAMKLTDDNRDITGPDLCRWQKMIVEEQNKFKADEEVPAAGIGQFRGVKLPINVRMSTGQKLTSFLRVEEMIDNLLKEMKVDRAVATKSDPLEIATAAVGDYLQEFEFIHPFVDGNGRTGRILANAIARRHGLPLLTFTLKDREKFYKAHDTRAGMRSFIYNLVKTEQEPTDASWGDPPSQCIPYTRD